MQGHSNLYDEMKEQTDRAYKGVLEVKEGVRKAGVAEQRMQAEIEGLKKLCSGLKERAVDAQCRSMKYNLLFHGIEESEDAIEDCEATLREFMRDKLRIEDEEPVPLKNAHRIGKKDDSRRGDRPRTMIMMIAKFVCYKNQTKVKQSARNPKDTGHGISEQYPTEVEDVRKKMYPIARAERQKGRKAYIVKDKLYVNKVLVDPATYVFEPVDSRHSTRAHVQPRATRDRELVQRLTVPHRNAPEGILTDLMTVIIVFSFFLLVKKI